MAVYGRTIYGTDTYGYDFPPAFRVDPFVATPYNYNSVNVSWSTPSSPAGTVLAYRLVKNRFGFPVDQDDGDVLIDSLGFPGNQFSDNDVTPGQYQYYGFYILITSDFVTSWVRSAVTACLMPNNYQTGLQIHTLMPAFYHLQNDSGVLDADVNDFPSENLDFFCEILGWGIDYLKTQYDTYLHVNDPWKISLKDLLNLAEQLGLNVNPDIHPYTLRKAVYYNATVNQQRGTTAGLVQELDILTGWSADLQVSQNFMLENDQSAFLDPSYPVWSGNITYNVGERVNFGNFWYSCISTGNYGNPPTGTSASNTWWSAVLSSDNNTVLLNPNTNNINTWEVLVPSVSNGHVASSIFEIVGISNPLNTGSFAYNGIDVYNKSGSTTTILARSISRVAADFTTNGPNFPPNKDQVTGDGIPVPFADPTLEWNGTSWLPNVRYGTDQIVSYGNVPFIALRASTNVVPPISTRSSVNNEWAPVSLEPRFRICTSAYVQSNASGVTATPFVDWFDASGNFITRVTARSTSPGVVGAPIGVVYDSFTYAPGKNVSNSHTDDEQLTWTQQAGTFTISPFADGCAYPASATTRTYATVVSGVSDCQLGVTFVTAPGANFTSGLLMRWLNDTNYLLASMSGILVNTGGSFNSLGTYTNPAQPGDRLIVTLSGSTITAFINGVQVLQVSSSQNVTGTTHGIMYDSVGSTGPGGTITVTNPGPQTDTVNQVI